MSSVPVLSHMPVLSSIAGTFSEGQGTPRTVPSVYFDMSLGLTQP